MTTPFNHMLCKQVAINIYNIEEQLIDTIFVSRLTDVHDLKEIQHLVDSYEWTQQPAYYNVPFKFDRLEAIY